MIMSLCCNAPLRSVKLEGIRYMRCSVCHEEAESNGRDTSKYTKPKPKVTVDEVVSYMRKNPNKRTGEILLGTGCSAPLVSKARKILQSLG